MRTGLVQDREARQSFGDDGIVPRGWDRNRGMTADVGDGDGAELYVLYG